MIFELLKGAMKGYDHGITEWDEPTVRRRPDGTLVKGRPTRGFGDNGTFSYAGKEYTPEPFSLGMHLIKQRAEQIIKSEFDRDVNFTFCLAGLYPEGKDGIPHHSDTVPTLDDLVFSISFGAPRVFTNRVYPSEIKDFSHTSDVYKVFTDNCDNAGMFKEYNYIMEDGDVIVFDGLSQMTSTHAVPAVHGVGERVNLTFRTGI